MKRLPGIILLLSLLTSCRNYGTDDSFDLSDPTPRLEYSGKQTLRYSDARCQEFFNASTFEFGVMTDNCSDFFFIKLSSLPTEAGSRVTGSADWTTTDNVEHRKNITFEVRKIEGDTYWLYSDVVRAVARSLE